MASDCELKMPYKTKLHSFRLTDDDSRRLDEIAASLPGSGWSRSSVIRHLITEFRGFEHHVAQSDDS